MNIFTQFFKQTSRDADRAQKITQDLIRRESELTRDIFGPVPNGTKRDFFCLDKNTWIWYEEWTDEQGKRQQMTTRYIIRPTEVLKSQNEGAYQRLDYKEFSNFKRAAEKYYKRITTNLYTDYQSTSTLQ